MSIPIQLEVKIQKLYALTSIHFSLFISDISDLFSLSD